MFPIMPSTKIAQLVLLCLATISKIRSIFKQHLVQIQNNFLEIILVMPSPKSLGSGEPSRTPESSCFVI